MNKELIQWAQDKYISSRLNGLDRAESFAVTKAETQKHLIDLSYYAGEQISDDQYSQLNYVLNDISFTQNSEAFYRWSMEKLKKSSVGSAGLVAIR